MMLNPIIAMIHNTAFNRWHPVIFEEKPLPGLPDANTPVRHKSRAHHTEGFSTREEALTNARGQLRKLVEKNAVGSVRECLEKSFEWDGKDIPAIVAFFLDREGELIPVM